MDLQYILTLNLIVLSAIAIVSVLMQMPWRNNVLWLAVNAAVIVVGLAAVNWSPRWSALLTAAVFVPFVVGPVAASLWSRVSMMQNRPQRAAFLARIAALLHPAARTRFNAAVVAAQAAPLPQARIEALRALKVRASPEEDFQLDAALLRQQDDWRGLLAHFRRMPERDSSMAALEIRALGELGRVDEMARIYEASKLHLHGTDLNDATLFVLAFGGKPAAVDAMLARSKWYEGESKAYWSAVARRAAGESENAWRPTLSTLADTGTHITTRMRAAAKLREEVVPASTELTPAGARIVDAAVDRLERIRPSSGRSGLLAAPFTTAMIAVLGIVYVAQEMNGGSLNLKALVDMGALWPPYVLDRGEWWRLITATFLHSGLLHLIANTLMLFVLGPQCETAFGSLRMLLVYVGGGIASSAFVLGLYEFGFSEASVLVGASGAIMAIFGGLVGVRIVTWLRHRDVLDKRFLMMVPVILAIQVAVDLSMPQVSLAAHASGFFAGLIIGTVLAFTIPRSR